MKAGPVVDVVGRRPVNESAWLGPGDTLVYLAVGDPVLRARVKRVLAAVASEIREVSSPFSSCVTTHAPNARPAVVMSGQLEGSLLTPGMLRRLRRSAPLLPIVLCLVPRDPVLPQIPAFARAGLDSFVILDGPDGNADLSREVATRLVHELPDGLASLFESNEWTRGSYEANWCARNGFAPQQVRLVAGYFRLSRRTILRDVQQVGWHDAENLIAAARLLHIAVTLDNESMTAQQIAAFLEFSATRELRKLVKRLTGGSLQALRVRGALEVASSVWRRRGGEQG